MLRGGRRAQALGRLAWHERGRGEPGPAREALPALQVLGIAPGPRLYRWTYVTVGAWLLDAGKDALEDRLESARGRAASEPPASRHSVPCATVSSLDQVARDVDPPHVGALLSANVAGTGPTTPPKQAAEPRPWAGGIAALEFPTGCLTRIRRQASRELAPEPGTRRRKRMLQ